MPPEKNGHLRRNRRETHIAIPTTTYVAYQKLTSPPSRPVAGGYQGMMTRNTFDAMLNITDTSHARKSALASPSLRRRYRTMYKPTAIKRAKIAVGYVCRSTIKLNASPAGGARIMRIVRAHWAIYGPNGVSNGRVDAQKRGKGRTPCLRIEVSLSIPREMVDGQHTFHIHE